MSKRKRGNGGSGSSGHEQRLEAALRLSQIIQSGPPIPTHVEDQLRAASVEAVDFHHQAAKVLTQLQPRRRWREGAMHADMSRLAQLMIATTYLSGGEHCAHLEKGPQPAVAALSWDKVGCASCIGQATATHPPAENDDRCDVCRKHGIKTFWPFGLTLGPVTYMGDACRSCAREMGIGDAA